VYKVKTYVNGDLIDESLGFDDLDDAMQAGRDSVEAMSKLPEDWVNAHYEVLEYGSGRNNPAANVYKVAADRLLDSDQAHSAGWGRAAIVTLPNGVRLSIVAGERFYSSPRQNRPSILMYDDVEVAFVTPGSGDFMRSTRLGAEWVRQFPHLAPYMRNNDDVMAYVPLEAVLRTISDYYNC
jgi:hypothetical protein